MTRINITLMIIISLLMAVGSWGLGAKRKTEDSGKQGTKSLYETYSVSLVSEKEMEEVKKASSHENKTYTTQKDVEDKLEILKGIDPKLASLNLNNFKDEKSVTNLEKELMPAPGDFKNIKTRFPVTEIDKDNLITILKPSQDLDPSFDVMVNGKPVTFVNLKEAKCWFSKDENDAPPAKTGLLLAGSEPSTLVAGSAPSPIYWTVEIVSPEDTQWLTALNKRKVDFNSLENGLGEYIREGSINNAKVIGETEKAKGEDFKKAMSVEDRINALKLTNKPPAPQPFTEAEITKGTPHYEEAFKGLGPRAKTDEVKKAAADYCTKVNADRKTKYLNQLEMIKEDYAYRWVIPYETP